MEPPIEGKLTWPPRVEDLRRLYLDEHLSAAKIAERYGLKYASPKTAESTILYHLKRNGITRRDKAEHARKVTGEMVDEWARRYEAGESLKQIAANEFSPVTVFLHLKKRGVQLRDKVEAQIKAVTKYERRQFCGDPSERAYILGFIWGDCSVEKHGRAVRVRSGTTHPEFANLFKSLFSSYGRVRMYPKFAKVTPAEWNLEVDLDGSFEFLLEKSTREIPDAIDDRNLLFCFLAGFADAEGSIYYHRKSNSSGFEFVVANTNMNLLKAIQARVTAEGYNPKLYHSVKKVTTNEQILEFEIWRLAWHRASEVQRILKVLPLRHKEKIMKSRIALLFMNGEIGVDAESLPDGWTDYLQEIKNQSRAFIREAIDTIAKSGTKAVVSDN